MSDNNKDVEAPKEPEASEEPVVEHALGTGAREAVDGDLRKSYVPPDVSPTATAVVEPVTDVGGEAVEHPDDQQENEAESADAPPARPSSPAH
jgi:hypothetical protein